MVVRSRTSYARYKGSLLLPSVHTHNDPLGSLRVQRHALRVRLREEALDFLRGHVACGRVSHKREGVNTVRRRQRQQYSTGRCPAAAQGASAGGKAKMRETPSRREVGAPQSLP